MAKKEIASKKKVVKIPTKKYVTKETIKLTNGKTIKKGGIIELTTKAADYHKSIKNI